MRFPDEYLIRFFYKNGLHQNPGRALELGCGNGNNLQLFREYDWDVSGIDLDVEDARQNVSAGVFLRHDLSQGLPPLEDSFNALLLPNMLNYLPREAPPDLLRDLRQRAEPDAWFFLRTRSLRDARYGRGKQAGRDAFVLDIDWTGERGTLQTFYSEHELVQLVRSTLGARELVVLETEFDNLQNGVRVANADLVLWGRCG